MKTPHIVTIVVLLLVMLKLLEAFVDGEHVIGTEDE